MVFGAVWSLLLAIAVVAQAASSGGRVKRQAGLATNLLIAVPFVLVLGFFYFERWLGGIQPGSNTARLGGAVLAAAGVGLYIAAHLYLGRNWSLAAAVVEGQRLVTVGPYRYVRHPMYTGMMVVVIGSGLLLSDYLVLASIVPVAAAYYVRARSEDALLAAELPGYADYSVRTKMFIPWVV